MSTATLSGAPRAAVASRTFAPARTAHRPLAWSLPCLCVWAVALAADLYVKHSILNWSGYRIVARTLGRVEALGGQSSRSYLFPLAEQLSFYRSDLLWMGVVAPLAGMLLLWRLKPAWRIAAVMLASFAVAVFLMLQLRGFWLVQQFQSMDLWRDALAWAWLHPEDARQYGGVALLLKVAVVLGLCVGAGVGGMQLARLQRRLTLRTPAILACGITAIAWAVPMRPTVYHQSALWTCGRAFLGLEEVDVARYDRLDAVATMQQWRALTHSPEAATTHFAAAAGYDLIFFVMETAPAKCLDIGGDLAEMPSLRRLRPHSWLAARHYSTYPYTRRAIFSLLSGWYPPFTEHYGRSGAQAPGLMQSLRQAGYCTTAYKPYPDSEEDEALLRSEGISSLRYAQEESGDPAARELAPWRERARSDMGALRLLKDDIAQRAARNQRYAAIYLPQIGHAPWADAQEKGQGVTERGRGIMQLQDRWLGEILDTLQAAGRLERTLIVVAGDHGIRTTAEDPAFEGGRLDPYSFQVPLLLYAPGVRQEAQKLTWPTSHIDVAPSLLELLGLRTGREWELGAAIWDSRLRERTIFFFAGAYLGADGYYDGRRYGMWQRVSDVYYQSNNFDFSDAAPLAEESARQTRELIHRALALQYRLMRAVDDVSAGDKGQR